MTVLTAPTQKQGQPEQSCDRQNSHVTIIGSTLISVPKTWSTPNSKWSRDGFTGGVRGVRTPPSPGQGGVLFFMIKQKIIRDKMRFSNLSNNMISEQWTTITIYNDNVLVRKNFFPKKLLTGQFFP
jgi:hypothetical protein